MYDILKTISGILIIIFLILIPIFLIIGFYNKKNKKRRTTLNICSVISFILVIVMLWVQHEFSVAVAKEHADSFLYNNSGTKLSNIVDEIKEDFPINDSTTEITSTVPSLNDIEDNASNNYISPEEAEMLLSSTIEAIEFLKEEYIKRYVNVYGSVENASNALNGELDDSLSALEQMAIKHMKSLNDSQENISTLLKKCIDEIELTDDEYSSLLNDLSYISSTLEIETN